MKHVTRRGYRLNTNLGDLYNSYIIDLQNRQSRDSFWITWLTWFCVFTKRLNQKVTNDFQNDFPDFQFTKFAQIWADFDIFQKFIFSNSHHSKFSVTKIGRNEMVKLIHLNRKWSISDWQFIPDRINFVKNLRTINFHRERSSKFIFEPIC